MKVNYRIDKKKKGGLKRGLKVSPPSAIVTKHQKSTGMNYEYWGYKTGKFPLRAKENVNSFFLY